MRIFLYEIKEVCGAVLQENVFFTINLLLPIVLG
jgi:hypothetical protein